jgi:hypothetical protein
MLKREDDVTFEKILDQWRNDIFSDTCYYGGGNLSKDACGPRKKEIAVK